MKDTIILANNATIEVDAMASIESITVKVASLAEIQAIKDKLVADNLKSVQTKNSAGIVVGNYADMVLVDTWQLRWLAAGGCEVTFGLRDKTEVEKLRDEVNATQAVQDGAIADLGVAVSDMSAAAVPTV